MKKLANFILDNPGTVMGIGFAMLFAGSQIEVARLRSKYGVLQDEHIALIAKHTALQNEYATHLKSATAFNNALLESLKAYLSK